MSRLLRQWGFASTVLLANSMALAGAEAPLWELGMGFGGLSFPVYRGADQRRDFLMPVPYVIYRGETFKADRRGVRGELFESNRLALNVSGSASLPVGSGDVAARLQFDSPDRVLSAECQCHTGRKWCKAVDRHR